jgi:hypothetical protein
MDITAGLDERDSCGTTVANCGIRLTAGTMMMPADPAPILGPPGRRRQVTSRNP